MAAPKEQAYGATCIPDDPRSPLQLPMVGTPGQLLMTAQPPPPGAPPDTPGADPVLWLCTAGSTAKEGAKWRQVLLGPTIVGRAPLPR
jgi:hypothetical protein